MEAHVVQPELESMLKKGITTFMIRGIPRSLQEADLADELNRSGLKYYYNFLCIPWDSKRCRNMGYVFVNFVDETHARRACTLLLCDNGGLFAWTLRTKPSRLLLSPARVQGLAPSLQEHLLKGKPYAHPPLIFLYGHQVSLEVAMDLLQVSMPLHKIKDSPSDGQEQDADKETLEEDEDEEDNDDEDHKQEYMRQVELQDVRRSAWYFEAWQRLNDQLEALSRLVLKESTDQLEHRQVTRTHRR